MPRIGVCLAAMLLVTGTLHGASAQAPAPAAQKLSVERLKEMRAKWRKNRPRLRACRAEMKSKELTGNDSWFYIEDCMDKT